MKFRGVAIRLEEPLDLLPGNQDFPHHLAARQLAAPQQAADGFGAHVERSSSLVYVIGKRFRRQRALPQTGLDGFPRRQFNGTVFEHRLHRV